MSTSPINLPGTNPAAVTRDKAQLRNGSFPVVAIGASAGGLEAFQAFLANLPVDTGMAFVLIQHLDPSHESQLAQLLSRTTSLPVAEAEDGREVKPEHVYVITRGTNMAISGNVLKLTPRGKTRSLHLPVDFFFQSLAEARQQQAIAVVLSGTGSDGTRGVAEIKGAGGLTFAQDQKSAKYGGMPQNAVNSGCIDFVLDPGEIAREIGRIGRHPYLASLPQGAGDKSKDTDASKPLGKILALLRSAFGVDFSQYRGTTVERRIHRRMVLHHYQNLLEYVDKLKRDNHELELLYQDILIHVTSFFRDPGMFDALKQYVFPEILKHKSEDTPIRLWVAGCSTGQEAYSLAIALTEFLEDKPRSPEIQVFATDLSEFTLAKARLGYYPESIEGEVTPERLQRFFRKEDGGYRVVKSLRDLCVFAKQDLASDPPFSRQDLISCRNVLIYLSPPLQKRIIPVFHYALNPTGFLLLGSSESIGTFSDIFNAVNREYKIYSKRAAAPRIYPGFSTGHTLQRTPAGRGSARQHATPVDWEKEADRVATGQYVPVGILVNDRLEVVQFRGRTAPYLEPPSGAADFNLLKMAREGLFAELRAGINDARVKNEPVKRTGVRVRVETQLRIVDLKIIPLHLPDTEETFFLVLFEEPAAQRDQPAPREVSRDSMTWWERWWRKLSPGEKAGPAPPDARELEQLHRELAEAREHQLATQEQMEAANEELRSANEEILSSNEELQSTNEEMETAKEELQSMNEELTTVNDQLQHRNSEMSLLNDDLNNFLNSSQIPMLMLGSDLCIRRFTPRAEKILHLHAEDHGRPIDHIKLGMDLPGLPQVLLEVMETVQVHTQEIQDGQGRWYTLRIHPYRTAENRIDGTVVTLLDIDDIKLAQQKLKAAAEYAEAIITTVRKPLIVLNGDLRVRTASSSFYRVFQTTPEDTEGRLLFELGDNQWNIPELRRSLEEILPQNNVLDEFQIEQDFPGIGMKVMLLSARRLLQKQGEPESILISIEDISERKHAEEALRLSEERYRTLFDSMDQGYCVIEMLFAEDEEPLDYRFLVVNTAFEKQSGLHGATGKRMRELVPDHEPEWFDIFGKVAITGKPVHFVKRAGALGNRWFENYAFRLDGQGVRTVAILSKDITEEKQAVEDLQVADRRKDEFLAMLGHELRNPLAAISTAGHLLSIPREERDEAETRDVIVRQTRLLVHLVDDLLDVSRMTRGKIPLRKEVLDAAVIIGHAVETVRPLVDKHQHVLEVTPIKEPLWLQGDPVRLEQVFLNLLTNAIKYSARGGHIRLSASREGSGLIVSVRDTGQGISAEFLPHVFELFSQHEHLSDRGGGGMGIGLTIVHSIVTMHGGSIETKSDGLGKGSEFIVRLPMLDEQERTKASSRSRSEISRVTGPSRRVLVVEDNRDVARQLSHFLKVNGHQVQTVYDGTAALQSAATFKPEVVLMDIGLPGLDGHEVGRRMRQNPLLKDVLLIAISGYSQEGDRQRSRESGFDHHLTKPAENQQLLMLLAGKHS